MNEKTQEIPNIKFAIIAAGEGSRLANEGIDVPKPLVRINGECLIDRLIRIFRHNNASEIVVITRKPKDANDPMTLVSEHLHGMGITHIEAETPSSMHSFFELSRYVADAPFIMTTVDTIFNEQEFADYVEAFRQTSADAFMGVTDYIDDEKPLYIETSPLPHGSGEFTITNFLDADPERKCRFISGGIYGLKPRTIQTLNRCMESGKSRMRNFQRGLIEDGLNVMAHPFSKVLDIDHKSDILKAEGVVRGERKEERGERRVLGIYRAKCFSPASVENDRRIMDAVLELLNGDGKNIVSSINEEEFVARNTPLDADLCLTMARSPEALQLLKRMNCRTINAPEGVELCTHRYELDELMRKNDIPLPPEAGFPAWLKRGNGTAMVPEDTVFCRTAEEESAAIAAFHERGINEIVRQQHVEGDLVKFYGVATTPFFHYLYPTDSGRSKFGSEAFNGQAHHYTFDQAALKECADRIARLTGVSIYGGDAIVREDGAFVIIDFNDWPTFSPCCNEAAKAIQNLTKNVVNFNC